MTIRRTIKIASVNLLLVVLLLVFVEGASSYVLTADMIARSSPIPERSHTEYDTLLGWVNLPGQRIENMYGEGVSLQTNAQRFRNEREFDPHIAEGRQRAICSGDSFTLGLGVANGQTWCDLLAAGSVDLETINMGQGGYGVDQAYLWYKRDGTEFAHDIHIFAFITEDFWRSARDGFLGYGKPMLALVDDSLAVQNTPVPAGSYRMPWLARTMPVLAELRTVKVFNGLLHRAQAIFNSDASASEYSDISTSEHHHLAAIVSAIFEDLQRINAEKGSRLILVYLPAQEDYLGAADTEHWRDVVRAEAARLDIEYVDMVEEIRKLPPEQFVRMFGDHAHYTEAGNAFVAEALRAAIFVSAQTLDPQSP